MVESFVMINDERENVYKKYISITGSEATTWNSEEIICDDMRFQEENGWCMMTLFCGDSFAEEILLELSVGNKVLYFFSDDVHMDCEFLAIHDCQILRKRYIYMDTPELNEDEGKLKHEKEFLYWNDIDYFIEVAKANPEKLFEQ